jgi:hypothetical protein
MRMIYFGEVGINWPSGALCIRMVNVFGNVARISRRGGA